MTFLLPSRQASWFGPACAVLGLGLVGLGVTMAVTQDGGAFERLLPAALPALVGVVLWQGGRLLASRRGGVAYDEQSISFFGDGPESAVRVPRASVLGLASVERLEGDAESPTTVASVELVLDSGVRLALADAPFSEALEPLTSATRDALGLGEAASARATSSTPRVDSEHWFGVGAQGRLPKTLAATGVAMLYTGIFAMLDGKSPVAGTFVGTPLVATGVILVLLPTVKRLLHERLSLRADGTYTHRYEALGLSWGERTGRADPRGAVRVRQRGALGATLELVGHRRTQLIAGGVQSGPGFGPAELMRLAEAIEAWRTAEPADR